MKEALVRTAGWLLTVGLALAPVAALAQPMGAAPAPACAATDKDLPAELSAWTAAKVPLTAASSAGGLSAAQLTIGQTASLDLAAVSSVTFVASPQKPAGPASYAGLAAVTVDQPGTYVVAIGGGAWVDVLHDGVAVASSAHGHGPACSTVRKWVEFTLQPGAYVLQLSGAPDAKLNLLVARKP
jgi:hypothetical protein